MPGEGDTFSTVYFGGSAVFRLSPCSEEVARHVAKRNQPEPVHQWELPKQIEMAPRKAPPSYDPDNNPETDDDRDEDDDIPFSVDRRYSDRDC